MTENEPSVRTGAVARGEKTSVARQARFLAAVIGVVASGAFFILARPSDVRALTHAEILHEVCRAARQAPNTAVVTDTDTECVFRTAAGSGTSTFYTYFSNASENNFCERTVAVMPGAPTFDRTTCGDVPAAKNLYQGITQSEILDELKGAEEAIRIVGEKVDYVEGTVQLLRDGGTMPATADLQVEPGDVVLTGKSGFVDIISDGGATWLSGDSTYGNAEIGATEPARVIAPDEQLDPQNFQLDELSWWQKVGLFFAGTYNPDVYGTAKMYSFKKAHIVYRGAAYFEEKTDGSSAPAMVVTPTTAVIPNGTAFLVEVEKDGATTVTTLDGKVAVADLRSGKVVSLGVNQAVTVPKTVKGLSAAELQRRVTTVFLKPIDRWWFDKITERNRQAAAEAAKAGERRNEEAEEADARKNRMFFGGLAALFLIGLIVVSALRSRNANKK